MVNKISKLTRYASIGPKPVVQGTSNKDKLLAYSRTMFVFSPPDYALSSIFRDPKKIQVIHEGQVLAPLSKIKHIVKEASKVKWQDLVNVILSDEYSEEVKQDVRILLLTLEDRFPRLLACNYQIKQLMEGQSEAKGRLERLINSPPLQLSFPIKAHQLRENSPDHSSLFQEVATTQAVPWKPMRIVKSDGGVLSSPIITCLDEISKIEGLQRLQILSAGPKWLRDPLIVLKTGKYLLPSPINVGTKASMIGDKLSEIHPHIEKMLNSGESTLGGTSTDANYLREYANTIDAPFYFEGGNLIPANQDVYLCGSLNLLFSILNSYYLFSSEEKKVLC